MNDLLIIILRGLIPLIIIALIIGLIIAVFSILFKTNSSKYTEKIVLNLPGNNCGACGYKNCDEYANALNEKKASLNDCKLCNQDQLNKLSRLTGLKYNKPEKMRAQVMCSGTLKNAPKKFDYDGIMDCVSVSKIGTGDKACPYGCLGYGSCVDSCPFGAIKVENGVAVIEYEKCTGCGLCVKVCPKDLIQMVPYDSEYWIGCSCKESGEYVKNYCKIGCIGCGTCASGCPTNAIKITNNLATMDYSKCIKCGNCFEQCPRSTIWYGVFQMKYGDTKNI